MCKKGRSRRPRFFNGCPPLLFPVIITDQGQVINMGIKQR